MSRITIQVMIKDGGLQGAKSWAKARKSVTRKEWDEITFGYSMEYMPQERRRDVTLEVPES